MKRNIKLKKEKRETWYEAKFKRNTGGCLKGQYVRFHLSEEKGETRIRLFKYKYFSDNLSMDEAKEALEAVRDKNGKLVPVKDQEKTWEDYLYSFTY